MKRAKSWSSGVAVAGLVLGWASAARADAKQECAAAYEQMQALSDAGKLTAAREKAVACSAAACSAYVVKECAHFLTDLDESLPTVVLTAHDPSGADVLAVRVWLDGRLLGDRLETRSIPIDPGEHVFRFEMSGADPVEQKLSSGTDGASSTASSTASSGTGGAPTTCDGGTACSDVGMCTAPQSTLCVIDACTGGCCGTAYASAGATCHDNGGVICDGNGACAPQCDVGGTLYASGAAAPGSPCQVCTPSVSTSAFTAASDGTSCGTGASCAGGACVAQCDIGGTPVKAGTADPGNACQACDPTKSTTAYSPTNGATCGGAFPGTCQQNACVSNLYKGGSAFSLAVDSANVYWTQTTADTICTTAGCAMELSLTPGSTAFALAENQNRIFGIGVAGDTVYWSNNIGSNAGVVNACLTSGCANAPTTIIAGLDFAGFLALGQGWVFSSGAFPASLVGAPTAGGATTTLYTGPQSGALPEKVYVAGSTVYFAVNSTLLAYPIAGGAPVVLASGLANPGAIAVSSGVLYFTELAGGATGMGTVKQIPVAGGAVTTLATGQNSPTNLVTDGVSLYWTNTGSFQIMKMPIAGGVTPVIYAGGQDVPSGLALFGNTVYWAAASGVWMASPK